MKTLAARVFLAASLLAVLVLSALAVDAPDVVTPDGGRYYGPLVEGKLHGQGEVRYRNGRSYRGEFADGTFNGEGRFEYPNGDVYEGQFVNGEFTGKGRYTRKDGARYEGDFRDWKFHGTGRYTDPQGITYEGNFVEGSLEGRGKVAGEGTVYEGGLKHWRFHGEGKLRHANGDVYEGGFENGVYQGKGTLKFGKPREDGRTEQTGVWKWGTLPDEDARRKSLASVEAAMYEQKALLDQALASIRPSQPGRIQLYLLTVAGDGSQEVFRREVDFVQKAFAERFGTEGRSIALVNSRNTLDSAPMATVTSIRAAVNAIGARMNRDQDILFLFLTSHGSHDHELVLGHQTMPLRGLRAAELGEILRASGIRWKVVVVSACYSGGFVDALQDERTLVITAARRDRRSFGCADENDFTYFGRAFFKEALPGAGSFQQAFKTAYGLVEQWERKETKDAHSVPQIHSPAAIEAHLQRWWAGLDTK